MDAAAVAPLLRRRGIVVKQSWLRSALAQLQVGSCQVFVTATLSTFKKETQGHSNSAGWEATLFDLHHVANIESALMKPNYGSVGEMPSVNGDLEWSQRQPASAMMSTTNDHTLLHSAGVLCSTSIAAEHQLVSPTDVRTPESAEKAVYALWLSTDLKESSPGPMLQNQEDKVYVLPKDLVLQINEVLNVAQSAHSQLEDILRQAGRRRGADTTLEEANDENSGDTQATSAPAHINQAPAQPNQVPRPAGGSKLLKLKLTDGFTFVIGMEFRPLPQLPVDVPPGSKIIVKKGTICRRGVLLLQPDNVQFLQGGVPEMAAEHSFSKVLQRCFAMEDDDEQQNGVNPTDQNHAAAPALAPAPPPPTVPAAPDRPTTAPQPAKRPAATRTQAAGRPAGAAATERPAAPQSKAAPVAATPIVVGDDEDLDELLAAVVEDDLLMETTSGQSLSHTAEAAAAQSHSGQWMQGVITKFAEPLQPTDSGWRMAVEITPTGGNAVPSLALVEPELLTQYVGMTAQDFKAKRKQAKHDPDLKERLRLALQNLEAKLGSGLTGNFQLMSSGQGELLLVDAQW